MLYLDIFALGYNSNITVNMIKVQNAILRNTNRLLCYRLAFSKLKANRIQQMRLAEHPETNITNKALYLDYVEQVLKNKEVDLIKLEQELALKENQLHQEYFRRGSAQTIVEIQSIKLAEKKLRAIQEKMGIRDQEYLTLYRKFEADCAKSKAEMEEVLKKQYAELISERKLLRTKLSQFAELQSYQKYLNELHQALEAKSQELAQRQSMLSHGEHELQNMNSEYETQGKQTQQSQTSNRKRIKIFSTKLHYPSEQAPQIVHQNDTFSKWQNNERVNSGAKVPSHMNQSSAILCEDSKQDHGYYEKMDGSREDSYQSQAHYPAMKNKLNETKDTSVQVNSQNLQDASDRLNKQSMLLKFSKIWMRHAFDSSKTSITKKKLLAVNLWKMNACFDEGVSQSAINSLQTFENLWRKQEKLLYSSKMFPYNELSLKRRKYAELMFDLEQKIFHRKKIQTLLSSILTQRNRKQRLVFYLYFCRFVKNSMSQAKLAKINDKSKLGLTVGTASGTGIGNRSDLVSMNSSHILHEDHINLPHKKSASSLTGNKSQQISKIPSVQRLPNGSYANKQNEGKKVEQQRQKMKQIIAQKQRTQKLLAAQCVKLEGLIKMCMVLSECTFRTENFVMRRLAEKECQDRVNVLENQLKGLQFKFDLVITKCKLGLANSSNKISTLENLLEFNNLIR